MVGCRVAVYAGFCLVAGFAVLGVGCVAGGDDRGAGARWRVFVSHTSELREFPRGGSYVAAVERAVTACGHVIVDMADFPAADLPSAQLCTERVRVVRCVRRGAGHPVRVAGAGQAGGVVHGAGVRGRDRGGAGPAGVPAGHRGRGDGDPAVGVDRPGVRGTAGGVPPPGPGQRTGHGVVRQPGYAGAAGGTLAAGPGRAAPPPDG